jgi:predicted ABC-type ATPase
MSPAVRQHIAECESLANQVTAVDTDAIVFQATHQAAQTHALCAIALCLERITGLMEQGMHFDVDVTR